MARKKEEQARRSLSAIAALLAARSVDVAIEEYYDTAPRAWAKLGGREGIQARLRGMAVGESEGSIGILGPVPRLTVEEWQSLSTEHVESLRIVWDTWRGVAAGEGPSRSGSPAGPTRVLSSGVSL